MSKSQMKYILSLLLFGSNGVIASYILLSSFEIVLTRTLIGSIFLVAILLLSKTTLQSFKHKKDLFFLVLSGIAMGVSWLFLFQAYRMIGVSIATLSYYCGPALVMILSPFLFKEKLKPHKVVSFCIVMFGMVLMNFSAFQDGGITIGLFYGIMSAVLYALMIIFNKMNRHVQGLENTTIQLVISFLIVAIFVFSTQSPTLPTSGDQLLPILFLGLVNTGLGCYLYFSSIQSLTPSSVAILGYLDPLSALLFSAIFLHEKLTSLQWVSALFILGGAMLGELYRGKKK